MTDSKLTPEATKLLVQLIDANGGFLPRLAIVNTLQDLTASGIIEAKLESQGHYTKGYLQGYSLKEVKK